MNEERARIFLPFSLLIAILAVSTASIFIRFAQREAPSLVIAALRLTLASLALTPFALSRHRAELRKLTRGELSLGLLSGIFLAVHFATWITSLEYTSVASSVVLVSTGPLWVALLSPIFLKEPLTKPVLIGMALALLGGTVIGLGDSCELTLPPTGTMRLLSPDGSLRSGSISCPPFSEFVQGEAFLGNFLALAGAWAVAGYLMIGRRLRGGMTLIPYIFIVYGIAAVVLLGLMAVAGQSPAGFSPSTYVWILLLALVPQLIGHSTYNWALRYLPAALVSITTLGEPIGSAILAYFILREAPTVLTIFGGALILGGIYVSSRVER
ncbi:MAG: DMT family transporter [Anaerolineales bacterium]|nr:DMT family transporter [Anaerolineales bacterium]